MVNIPVIDWAKAPLQPGNPARAPSDGWKNWFDYNQHDIEEIRTIGEEDYLDEWKDQAQFGLDDIAIAAERVGIQNVNGRLNEYVGRAAALYASEGINHRGEIRVLDIGALTGNTSLAFWENIPNHIRSRVRFTAIDLSRKGLEGKGGYIERLREAGARISEVHVNSDLAILPLLEEAGYDIVFEVAVRHQHGENLKPTQDRFRVTREGGILLAGDWHVYDMWKHPARLRTVLFPMFDFDGKEEIIENFLAAYPHANDELPTLTPAQQRSNYEIARFWTEYAKVWESHKDPSRPRFRFIEGHRPAEDYLRDMREAGFTVDVPLMADYTHSNPFYIRPESTLNAVTFGIRR